MKQTENMTIEEKVRELQAQIDFLKTGGMIVSPIKRLQAIRNNCRKKYFGTWDDMKNEKTEYGPEVKKYSDYNAIRDIVVRTTDLLFRYSRGVSNGGSAITNLIRSEEDIKDYEGICDRVCRELKDKILQETARTSC